MKTIRQRNFTDCGICSLAMFLNKPYAEIRRDAHSFHKVKYPQQEKFGGFCDEMQRALLWKHSAKFTAINAYDIRDFSRANFTYDEETKRWEVKRGALKRKDFRKIIGRKKALLSCPSLNFPNKDHMVFWDGKKLHDPSNLKRYTAGKAFKKALSVIVAA